jgi:hypothetical protein
MGGEFRPEMRRTFSGALNVNQRQQNSQNPFYQNVSADMFLGSNTGGGGNLTTNFIMQ